MPPVIPRHASAPTPMERHIDSVLAEFHGDARAAIGALLQNRDELLKDADRVASLSLLRRRCSAGARPARESEI